MDLVDIPHLSLTAFVCLPTCLCFLPRRFVEQLENAWGDEVLRELDEVSMKDLES